MPTIFRYVGRAADGHKVSGDLKVNTVDDVVFHLKNNYITPIDIKIIKERQGIKWDFLLQLNPFVNKVDLQDVMYFCCQLAALNSAGVPIIKSINQLSQSSKSIFFKKILSTVASDISAGLNLSGALKKHAQAFPSIFVNIINIGENTGHLSEVLLQLSEYFESCIANRRRLLSTVRYPCIVIITVLLSIIFSSLFVIPKIIPLFSSFNASLPLATRIMIHVSNFILKYWKFLLIFIIILLGGTFRLLKITSVRYIWDKYRLFIPIFGSLEKRIAIVQFIWNFCLVLRSGVPIIAGIDLAASSTTNSYFNKQLLAISTAINHGESISRAIANSNLFTPIAIQMIEVGEESGKLDELLINVAKYYDAEIDYDLKHLNDLLQPILLIIVGSLVLVLALAVYSPMLTLIKSVKY